jgi:hypothetical protein
VPGAGRDVATLKRVVLDEGALHRIASRGGRWIT